MKQYKMHTCADCPTMIRERALRCNPCAFKQRKLEGKRRHEARNHGMRYVVTRVDEPGYVSSCWERWARLAPGQHRAQEGS